ncbi:hypothetical protein [Microbacterium testaceum]|uniref:hypothetical protein n=1 Tax=Microbacterium testaceum TaxID=2033 RepID=UPI00124513EE|nr:hypothetical protein [Microbacterium testaceum]
MDLETARFAGEHEGASLWLARGNDVAGVCLLVHVDDTDWASSCGGAAGPGTISGQTWTFIVVPDAGIAPAGYTAVSENVYTPTR